MKTSKIPQDVLLQEILVSMLGSFRMEGIIIEPAEAQAVLQKIRAKREKLRK